MSNSHADFLEGFVVIAGLILGCMAAFVMVPIVDLWCAVAPTERAEPDA